MTSAHCMMAGCVLEEAANRMDDRWMPTLADVRTFLVSPMVVSVLDYSKGFAYTRSRHLSIALTRGIPFASFHAGALPAGPSRSRAPR
jgi:hypothetical protein